MQPVVFKLPDLGEGVVEAEIVAWHVKPGEHVRLDQPLVKPDREASKQPRKKADLKASNRPRK